MERYVDKKLVYALLNDLVNQCSDKDELFDRAFDGVEALPEIAVASSKTAKREISDIITDLTRFDDLGNCLHLDEDEIAEAILAAGYRKAALTTYEETIKVSQAEFDRINRLLAIECFENMSDEEMRKAGANTDQCEGLWFVEFGDGSELTWDLCSGSSNYYDNVVWTSADDKRSVTLDCSYELDDIEVEIEGNLYVVKFEKE